MKNEEKMPDKKDQSVLLLGGFGHALGVFGEWQRESAPVRLTAAAKTLPDEPLDVMLQHPWSKQFTPAVYENTAEALVTEKPDFAIVSTRPGKIYETVRSAVEAGLDVIAEKPLALEEDDLRELFKLVQQSGRRVIPMFSMRALPAFIQARTWVREGCIGESVLVNARKSYKWGTRPSWTGDRDAYGGTWPWVGIHAVDMTHFITGLLPVSVTAHHANRAHSDYPGCEDTCAGIFRLDNGGMLTASVDILRPETALTHGDDFCRIVGTKGVIEANASAGTAKLLRQDADPLELDCGKNPTAIYQVVRNLAANPSAGMEETELAFKLTDAVLQARMAADSGQTRAMNLNQWNLENTTK